MATSKEDKQQQIEKYSIAQDLVGIRGANEFLSLLDGLNGIEKENKIMGYNSIAEINSQIEAASKHQLERSMNRLNEMLSYTMPISMYSPIVIKDRRSVVADVNVIVPNKVVEVTFANGSKQKTVCSENDEFSLELAISICITKNLIGGTSNYNKAVDNGIKVYETKLQRQEQDRKEEERIKAKRIKLATKRAEKIARKKEEEKERLIEIQKEAIIRAKLATFESNGVSYKL
jgi:hypothetical protein